MKLKNLEIIGTSHIAKESQNKVRNYIESKNPKIIALELDSRRAHALLHGKGKLSIKDAKVIGFKGYLFLLIASFLQKKLGKLVGTDPGAEMKMALKSALKQKAKIAFIDRDIQITLKRLSQTLSWRERIRFVTDIISGFFSRPKELSGLDLRKVPSKKLILKLLSILKLNYPNLYNVLVAERNEYMAASLANIMRKNPNDSILAVIGAGHEDEVCRLIKDKLSTDITYSYSVA